MRLFLQSQSWQRPKSQYQHGQQRISLVEWVSVRSLSSEELPLGGETQRDVSESQLRSCSLHVAKLPAAGLGQVQGMGNLKGCFETSKQASNQPTPTTVLKGDTPWGNADKNIFPKRKKTHVVFSFCALPSPVWQLVQKWDAPLVQEATGTQLHCEQHARLEDAISHSMCQYMSWKGISPRVQEELK